MKSLFLGLILSVLINGPVNAGEVRYIETLPTSGKTSVKELNKTKSAGWSCQWAKTDGNSGNTNKTKTSKTYWYPLAAIPEATDAQDTKINELLDAGKKVVKCTLKERDSESKKMRNADLESDEE